LERLLSIIGLRFADAETERAFRQDFTQAVLPIQRVGLILALIVMGLFTIRDVQLTSVLGPGPLMFRLFVIIPFIAGGLALSFTQWVRRQHQLFFLGYCLGLVVIVHILYSFATPTGPTDPRFGFRAMSSMLLIAGVVTLSGLRFEYAVLCALSVVAGWIWSVQESGLDPSLWPPTLVQLIAMTLLTSGVSYWIERSHRLQFGARRALDVERAHTEQLLSHSMPERALARLKKGDQQIADAFLEAVVLFVDLAGFTDLSKRIGPHETVRVLDRVFTAFDDIVARHGLERVKTMGDGYIAIGGTSDKRQDDLQLGAQAAHQMVKAVARMAEEFGLPLGLRVGLHVGPVIGGVIGRERPTYDYWGDTLNIAARLEMTGEAGRVHCSEAIYWRLRGTWELEARGPIELKGYRTVETYYLNEPARPLPRGERSGIKA
jgi:adenylate cyclase